MMIVVCDKRVEPGCEQKSTRKIEEEQDEIRQNDEEKGVGEGEGEEGREMRREGNWAGVRN